MVTWNLHDLNYIHSYWGLKNMEVSSEYFSHFL